MKNEVMTAIDYREEVEKIVALIFEKYSKPEPILDELRKKDLDYDQYGFASERYFEKHLRSDYKRITSLSYDFSVAECLVETDVDVDGIEILANCFRNALNLFKGNIKYLAELVMVLNLKSWEHYERGNTNYAKMYSALYYKVLKLYFDSFRGTDLEEDAVNYYYKYID